MIKLLNILKEIRIDTLQINWDAVPEIYNLESKSAYKLKSYVVIKLDKYYLDMNNTEELQVYEKNYFEKNYKIESTLSDESSGFKTFLKYIPEMKNAYNEGKFKIFR